MFGLRARIIEARDLQAKDATGTSDPFVEVELLGKKERTPIIKQSTTCIWDHSLQMEFDTNRESFLSTGLRVAVYDANSIKRNVLIGEYLMDMNFLFEQEGHEVYKMWVGLSKPGEEEPQGYVKLTLTMLIPGVTPPSHSEEEEDDEADSESSLSDMVLMPPAISRRPIQLKVKIYRGEDMIKADRLGKCDAYIKVVFGGDSTKSSVQKNTLSPVWNEMVQMPLYLPAMSSKIILQLYDYDRASKDDLLATAKFDLKAIRASPFAPQWVNLYGPAIGASGPIAKSMLNGDIPGSKYRGRILVGLEISDIPDGNEPKTETVNLPVGRQPVPEAYSLFFDLYQATELKAKSTEAVSVSVMIGAHTLKSSKVRPHDGRAEWKEQFKTVSSIALPTNAENVPDIFISVSKKAAIKRRIGYIRLKAADVLTQKFNENPKWMMLDKDIGVASSSGKGEGDEDAEGSDTFAGFIQCRLNFMRASNVKVERPKMIDLPTKPYRLYSYVFQGQALPAADENGLSDPYLIVRWMGQNVRSKVIDESVNPLWYQLLEMKVDVPDQLSLAPDLYVTCYDSDKVSADDPLGFFTFPSNLLEPSTRPNAQVNWRHAPRPKWYTLKNPRGEMAGGSILVSFRLVPENIALELPSVEDVDISPKRMQTTVEVDCVGLRGHSEQGKGKNRVMASLKSPYIELDCGDRTPELVMQTKPVQTVSGENPNFLEVLSFPAMLPYDPLYTPSLNVKAYDSKFGGRSKKLIGVATVNLEPYMAWVPKLPSEKSVSAQSPGAGAGAGAEQSVEGMGGGQTTPHAVSSDQQSVGVGVGAGAGGDEPCNSDETWGVSEGEGGGKGKGKDKATADSGDSDISEHELNKMAGNDNGNGKPRNPDFDIEAQTHASVSKPTSTAGATLWGNIRQKISLFGSGGGSAYTALSDDVVRNGDLIGGAEDDSDGEHPTKHKPATTTATTVVDPNDPILRHALVKTELERTFTNPDFFEVPLYSGRAGKKYLKRRNAGSSSSSGSAAALSQKQVGTLKIGLRIHWDRNVKPPIPPPLREIFSVKPYVVRVYITRGIDLVAKDVGGLSDPYIELSLGKTKIDDEENRVEKTLNPEFFRSFEIPCSIPGDSLLTIAIMDWDKVGANDLIGRTTIDLEDRIVNTQWKGMSVKPRERRQLWSPQSSLPQGSIELWTEILTADEAKRSRMEHIGPPEPRRYELRVIVWETRNCAGRDKKGTSDQFVKIMWDGMKQKKQKKKVEVEEEDEEGEGEGEEGSVRITNRIRDETDVHWKAEGAGLFNYRLLLDTTVPNKIPRLRLSVWDKDLVGSNELIGESVLNLAGIFRKADRKPNEKIKLRKQWVAVRHTKFKEDQGEVQIELEMLPEEIAMDEPAGRGQKAPQELPKPKRPPGAFNPLRIDLLLKYHLNRLYKWFGLAVFVVLGMLIALVALYAHNKLKSKD